MSELFQSHHRGALFSDCGAYRYRLWRIWDDFNPPVMFIGLNPSKADAADDDPTIRRVIGFAKRWGFGGVYMTNLFGLISTDPDALLTAVDPVGQNDEHLREVYRICKMHVVYAWGAFKQNKERAALVSTWFFEPRCLGKNKDGSPKHPLYVKGDIEPIKFHTLIK